MALVRSHGPVEKIAALSVGTTGRFAGAHAHGSYTCGTYGTSAYESDASPPHCPF
ncbi:hypothetical protein ABT160_12250 [Streptomyces sp. NPDC001941]|uniref:hypothetical protein n=1 Tax=Streptomyces sp. NPDC001941 TaxID=3154659 RepID=UPI0033255730